MEKVTCLYAVYVVTNETSKHTTTYVRTVSTHTHHRNTQFSTSNFFQYSIFNIILELLFKT
jgi:hypothetical protein